jgi:Predicted pyridoxal phosphate-dependent enzyme apparently involved in regulation of cell wall biogenesis
MDYELAINGGRPVRETPLPLPFPGTSLYGEEEKKSAMEVLERKSPFRYYGSDVLGKVKEFEKHFCGKMGAKYALGVSSGTASLITALKAAGIGPGDKVIVPALTFIATAAAVILAGAVPIFADIDDSMNLDPEEISKLADEYTKAVIPVHILGNPCDMESIMKIALKKKLVVIEDVAQSCGCKYRGKYCGTFGEIGCFSLQINKIITTGDGGVLITNHDALYERAVRYHDQGLFRERDCFPTIKEEDVFIGQNYRMNEVTGAIALEQLKKLDNIISTMRDFKYMIKDQVEAICNLEFRRINDRDGEAGNAIIMILPDKGIAEKFRDALNAENIANSCIYGGKPVYMMPQIFNKKTVDKDGFPFNQFSSEIIYKKGMCPRAEELMPRSACISISPGYSQKDVDDIIKGIRKVIRYLF